MNLRVLLAVFKRNLVGYFTNPTGYVFICVFVLLSSVAAFLPYEFFSANLANLDQLNRWIPLIMLVFIPAITMGIWAEERRQGTDELLLTIPASDFDIVIGKYKAASSIFLVSLLFSMLCSYLVLAYLGKPDIGLFVSTYIGYYLIGMAMLSIGMAASFLTRNLTIAYIFGVLFNAPLVALQWADSMPIDRNVADALKRFSISEQFDAFGRGILSLSHFLYFAAIVVVMLYVSMILIGRRHWTTNQNRAGTFHFSVRTVSLVAIGLFVCVITARFDLRADLTDENLSTLSPRTLAFLNQIDPEHPVIIDAYISPDVPKSYIQTRLDLISLLSEISSRAGKNVSVAIHQTEPNTETALLANQRYGIEPKEVMFSAQGIREAKKIFLGVAMRSGLKTLTLPFIDRGLSVEYELIHALGSLSTPLKKRIGILSTEAKLFGGFDMATFTPNPAWRIVEELKKQYIVVEVNPAEPITEKYDALVAVQPSSLGPAEMANFVDALKKGQPSVIFEDPFPIFVRDVPGTSAPKSGPRNPMMPPRNMPKGDISALWALLGVNFEANWVLWQEYNPIPKMKHFPKGFVFIDRSNEQDAAISSLAAFDSNDEITRHLRSLLLVFPGTLSKNTESSHKYTPLLKTFREPVGYYQASELRRPGLSVDAMKNLEIMSQGQLDLAVRINGLLPKIAEEAKTPAPEEAGEKSPQLNIVLITDIDLIADGFFDIRAMGNDPDSGLFFDFDNISFVLNAIDSIAGDERFIELRSRRPKHRTLERFDAATRDIRNETAEANERRTKNLKETIEKASAELDQQIQALRSQLGNMSQSEQMIKISTALDTAKKRLDIKIQQWQREATIEQERADVNLSEAIKKTQGRYKLFAVLLPPILPLFVGFFVFAGRRLQEYEGVPKSRRKK